MKLSELLDVVENYLQIMVFIWDTGQSIYLGPNVEHSKALKALREKTVLYLSIEDKKYTTEESRHILRIGVK